MDTLNENSGIDCYVPVVVTKPQNRKQVEAKKAARPSNHLGSSLSSGAITNESTHVLVDDQIGVTTRLHSPGAKGVSDDKDDDSLLRPRPFRCDYTQRQWMRVGQAIGVLIPVALAVSLVTPVYLIAVGVIGSMGLVALAAKYAIITCVGTWMAVTVAVSVLLTPFLSQTFGYHVRLRQIPCNLMPDSMHRLFIEMRIALLTLAVCQSASALAGYFFFSSSAPLEVFSRWSPVLVGSAMFLTLGIFVLVFGHVAFLQTRGRKVRDWLRNCWRGVALRSFIPAWDNARRPIFDSCRASRRLAAAYRSIKMGAAGCFAAGGCLAAMSVGNSMLGIAMLAVSIVATVSVWPTATRIVNWTKVVVDPISGHTEDD